jgi:hypothetical protein
MSCFKITVSIALNLWGRSIIRPGVYMSESKIGGKLTEGVVDGKTMAHDSAKGSAPANFVRPKATDAPAKPNSKKD